MTVERGQKTGETHRTGPHPEDQMRPERWQRIDQLFHQALSREPDQRAVFLTTACADDESLRLEVESLISAHEDGQSFIETPPGDIAAEMLKPHQSTFEPGQQIENYRIIRRLGSGGMGEVYLADDVRLNRKVALKLLPPHFNLNPDRVRRFEREARAALALNHPNIVTIYEIGHSSLTHFIATEFVDGKTLRQLMNEKPLTLNETLNVGIQVAGALSGAHAAGIVHRDIKPENIMVRADGYVKILDFGLAKLTETQAADSDTETPTLLQSNPGLVMGTVQYMSPEQARGAKVDVRTDIWSLGIVLYELLAGRVPFSGDTPSHVMVSLMEDKLQPVKSHAQVPEALDRVISQALCKNQDHRYQTANQLWRDLKALKQTLQRDAGLRDLLKKVPSREGKMDQQLMPAEAGSFAPHPSTTAPVELPSGRTASGESVVDRFKHHKIIFATILLGLVAVAIGLGYVFRSRSTSRLTATSRSIAVLPFKNDTGEANIDYVSDGLSETLINDLAQLPELRVTARNSAFKYKSKDLDPREVARSLGVESILMGRIAYRGDQILISVEVINGADGTHLWGDEYTRKESDLILIKSEISRDIVRALRVRLTAGEQQQLVRRETVNPQAYELLMKGRFYRSKGSIENRRKGLACFEEAIAVDPNYAPAHAELSRTLSGMVTNNVLHPKEGMPRAEASARRALELDEGLADAHLVMADAKMKNWDWLTAEREYKRALELSPNFSAAHIGYTFFLIIHRRDAEALAQARRARELDPLSTMANAVVVYGLVLNRQFDEALDRVNEMLELDRSNPFIYVVLGQFYGATGQHQKAIAAFQEAIRLGDDSPDEQTALGNAFARSGQPEKTRAIIQRLERGKQYVSHTNMAILYASLGDFEQAFSRLELAYETRDEDLMWLRVTPMSDQLNSDPHFDDLLKRVGLK